MPSIMPGQFYWWQFYLREALLDPHHLLFISEQFWKAYEPRFHEQPFQLAGAEQASLPIITALLMAGAGMGLPVNAFSIRKEYKTYGMGNIIEGRPTPDVPVVLIDDLTSPQHRTLWHCVRVLNRAGFKLYPHIFVLVYKGTQLESRQIATSIGTVHVESIFTLDDFTLTWEDYQAKAKT